MAEAFRDTLEGPNDATEALALLLLWVGAILLIWLGSYRAASALFGQRHRTVLLCLTAGLIGLLLAYLGFTG